MGTTGTLLDVHAAWNAGLREGWDPGAEYSPGDAVTDTTGLAGWLAIEPSRGVMPSLTGEGQRVWAMVWSSCGPGHVGAASASPA